MHTRVSVLSYLESSAERKPDAVAVEDEHGSFTYAELFEHSRAVGSALIRRKVRGRAVVVAMEKSCQTLSIMMGILYAGCHYVTVNPDIPEERMGHILDVLGWPPVVTGEDSVLANRFEWYDGVMAVSELEGAEINPTALESAQRTVLENDPAYVLFTSGSTGVPKGVAISHRAICCFIDAFVDAIGIGEDDRIGNQAPFDFDVSTKDIYSAFATGATLVIVPRELFMKPMELITYLADRHVTVLIWAVAALCIMSSYHVFDQATLPDLRIVAFSGEVMPYRHLREWRDRVSQAAFFNLYGPTEITCNCLYYRLEEGRTYEDGIPLGIAFEHDEVFLLDEKNEKVVDSGVSGEIVVRGPSLALGYVGAMEEDERAFVRNPLHDCYPDRIYRTGDLASYNAAGELLFLGRKDNQVKHMGHRIELEEVDFAIEQMSGIQRCRCVYDSRRKRLRAFFEGEVSEGEVRRFVAKSLPVFMRPSTIRRVEGMPINKNGKVDRAQLLDFMYRTSF